MIDLDLAPPPPKPPWRPSPRLRRALRPILAAALVAAAAMTLGAASSVAPGVTRVLSVDGEAVGESLMGPAVLYTAESDDASGPGSTIRARPLAGGAPRWTTTVPQSSEGPALRLAASAGVLIVGAEGASPVAFLDAATGAIRWRIDQDVEVFPGDHAVLVKTPGSDDGPDRLRLADLRSGHTIWSRTAGRITALDVDSPAHSSPEHVFTIDQDGRAAIYRFADGRRLATGDLGVDPERWDGADPDSVAVASLLGDRLYIHTADLGRGTLTAYRLPSLTRLWSAASVPLGQPQDCAGLLCVAGGEGVTVLNPADGSARWTDRRWSDMSTSAEGLILATDADETTAALLDPADGRVVRSPGNGVVRAGLLLRSDGRTPGRIWISDLVTGKVVATLDGTVPAGCVVLGQYVGCPTVKPGFAVWRMRSGPS